MHRNENLKLRLKAFEIENKLPFTNGTKNKHCEIPFNRIKELWNRFDQFKFNHRLKDDLNAFIEFI